MHTVDTLLTRLEDLGYPICADTMRDAIAHGSAPGWAHYVVCHDIQNSATHGATRADIYRARRVVDAIVKRVS